MFRLLFVVFAAFCVEFADASSNRLAAQKTIVFDRLGTDDGLSQALATSFVQDELGYVWIGTQEGLNRFDGFSFKHFYHQQDNPSSLRHERIWSLYADSKGRLWVGTEAGLNLYSSSTEDFLPVELKHDEQGEPPVYALLEDSSGQIWVGTADGLFSISNDQNEIVITDHSEWGVNFGVRAIAVSQDGESLWLGSDVNGLYEYKIESDLVAWYSDISGLPILDDLKVREIIYDQEGQLWIATFDGGVSRLDVERETVQRFTIDRRNPRALGSSRVRTLLRDNNDDIWVGSDFGLHLWDGEDGFTRFENDLTNPRSLSDNSVHSLYQDEGGVVWVGTFHGISKWNANVSTFPLFKRPTEVSTELSSTNVTSFAEDSSSNVWVGTLSGLMKWDSESQDLSYSSADELGLRDFRVMSLASRGEELWVGTASEGINVLKDDQLIANYKHDASDVETLGANGITSMLADSLGRMWVTTYGGGVALYMEEGKFRRFRLGEGIVRRAMDIVEVTPNEFWVATQGGGVAIIDLDAGSTEYLTVETHGIVSDNTLTLLAVDYGVYIGTVDNGISFFDLDTKQVTNYSKESGLISDAIYGLLEDDFGNVWISSAKGLTSFEPNSKFFTSYDTIHGLQSSDFNSGAFAKLSDSSLAFGGIEGFNVFYPSQINQNKHVPPVLLTDLKIFNESVQFDVPFSEMEMLELDHDQSVVSISFASMDFTAPHLNRYRYKLDGFDRDWVEANDQRMATYTNLDAGAYVFKVQGSNNDGVWNEQGASVQLIVNPAPWATWWAYCIYTAILVIGLWRLYKYNTDRLQREAERRYSERLQLYIESLEEASDCILIADSAGVLMYANNTITHGLNRAPSEVIGESMWTVLFEDESDVEAAQQNLEREGRYHGEVLLAGPGGSSVTHEVTIALVQQSSMNEKAYVGISRDVTDRKITEAELEDYRKNLEELVEERTEALQKEIAENKAIQVHLADSLQEKELLIKEVHHRVKNNMQVISSLLSIQAQGAGDEVYSNLLNESQQRIKSMALIHETLYQSKDLLKIDFQEYIESLTTSLSRSYIVPGVSVLVDVHVDNVELDLETAVPCGLVINELVSNSLKHAFKGQEGTGVIDIDFVINQCDYKLRIADNGIGLPESFDLTKNTSMGMEIVSILTSQLEGELNAHNDEGAVFEISFPRAVNG